MMNSFISDDDEKWLMFNAKFSSADEVYESVYRQAKSSIYVVDNYIGLRTLVHLKNSPTGVDIILFSDNVGNNKFHNIEYTDFRKEQPTVKLSMKKTGGIFHDRFIVLDYGTADERVFLCGASSKDAGARITSIVEDYGTAKYNSVIAGLLKNSPLVLPKQECEIIAECTDAEKKQFMQAFIERIDIFPERREDGNQIRNIKFQFPTLETVCLLSRV